MLNALYCPWVVRRVRACGTCWLIVRLSKHCGGPRQSLLICTWSEFSPRRIERWRGHPSATWLFWYPDHLANLRAHRVLLAPYDHFFFKGLTWYDTLLSRTRLPVHMLAQACNPDHHHTERPANEEERRRYDCDVAVAGNLYPYRLLVMAGISGRRHASHLWESAGCAAWFRPCRSSYDSGVRCRANQGPGLRREQGSCSTPCITPRSAGSTPACSRHGLWRLCTQPCRA